MSLSFTAIDFETAQGKRWSICQVGLVRVENGIVVNTMNQLVRPPDNAYFYRNTDIHGITPAQTRFSPEFPAIWQKIKPFIQGQAVVAHNGAFDFSCLAQTLEFYGLELPTYTPHCTYKIYHNNLASLCREHQIRLNHHDALSDAMACAQLFLIHLNS